MDFNLISTFADLLQMGFASSLFDFGVNAIGVEGINNLDSSAVVAIGPHNHCRFQWGLTTTHDAQPQSGAIDAITPENIPKIFDLDQPNQWDNLGGQMTQREYEAEHGNVDEMGIDSFEFFMNANFDADFPALELE